MAPSEGRAVMADRVTAERIAKRIMNRLESIAACGGKGPCSVCDGQVFAVKEDIARLLALAAAPPADRREEK